MPCYVAETDEQARREAEPHLLWLFHVGLKYGPFGMPPGYVSERSLKAMIAAGGKPFTELYDDWRRHLGVSWVLAWDSDGRIGRGPLLHVSGYVAAGALWRRDALGKRRGSLVISLDALSLLNPDEIAQAHRQAHGIAGKLLSGGPGS